MLDLFLSSNNIFLLIKCYVYHDSHGNLDVVRVRGPSQAPTLATWSMYPVLGPVLAPVVLN